MFLDDFFAQDGDHIHISSLQASRFAKEVAGDFNPIHDPMHKRFCVPGDLLFSLVLARQGLSRHMRFTFSDMLGAGVPLHLPATPSEEFELRDRDGKTYMKVGRGPGEVVRDEAVTKNLIRNYVAFSGHTFPHVLVPLMEAHGVMINTQRPLVIYESMSFDLWRTDGEELALEPAENTLRVTGKRGEVRLNCRFMSAGEEVGTGCKRLLLSALRDYDPQEVQGLVDRYAVWKSAYAPRDELPAA